MAPKSPKEQWDGYEREFKGWLDREIEALQTRLEDLIKIRDSMHKEDNHD